jgi:quercetin dioxygenase-like cupin family protein
MQSTETRLEIDRRATILLGVSGAVALLGGGSFALAEDVKVEELAPGVTLKTFREVEPIGPVPGYKKALLMELTFQPGSKFGPDTSKTVDICEISGAPLYVEIEGKEPFTLNPGDIYFCPVGNVETDTNKSDKPSIMRIVELVPV